MKIEGWLKPSQATGRAEFTANGEVFSFPSRLANHFVTIYIPEAANNREADPLLAAGASPAAMRGIFRINNGRAELTLASNELISIPARYAGRMLAIDVRSLAQVAEHQRRALEQRPVPQAQAQAQAQAQNQAATGQLAWRAGGDRAALNIPFDPDDLDVL